MTDGAHQHSLDRDVVSIAEGHSIHGLDNPVRFGWLALLRDGSSLVVRPFHPEDRPAVAALFARLSPQSLYMRYHSSTIFISDALLDLVTADHALVAELDGQIVALGSYHPLRDPRQAEVALVVDDHHQGLGIGKALYSALADDAQREGIGRLLASVLRSNGAMLRIFQRSSFPLTSTPAADEVEVQIDLLPTAA